MKIIDDPTPFTIDVLRMELEQKLPYWLSPEGKGLREDAMAANHTGAAVAGFDPLLMRKKRRERLFRRKRPILEADVEALPASGGVGETDMNSVLPKRKKFRIRHGKSLKEAYNPNEPREAKGTPHGGRWTSHKGGDCYSSAFHIMDKIGKHGTLVHAIVSGQGALTGKRYDHAWTEINDTIIDQSNGRSIVMPKADYYALGNVNTNPGEYRRYTYKEMIDKAVDTGTYGPWDLDLSKTKLDVPWRPDPEAKFVEFPPIKIGEEDQTISKETIEKLHLTEDDLKARRRVLTQGSEDKSEHLIAFDDVGWENHTSNNLTRVSLPDTLVETLRNTVARYTLVHNHPWDSSLSGGDLNVAALPAVKRMFAHVATGSIYSVEQTQLLRDVIKYSPTKYQNLWDAMSISARTIQDILSPFNSEFNSLKILRISDEHGNSDTLGELRKYWWRIGSHLNCLLLNDAGVFKYEYHMDPKMEKFYGPLIKKARESNDWKISKNAIYHEMQKEVDEHKPPTDPGDLYAWKQAKNEKLKKEFGLE